MATFKSKAYIGGVPFRPTEEGPFEVTASILVPSGTAIAAADVFKFMDIGANVSVQEVTLRVDDLDTGAAMTINAGLDYYGATTDVPAAFLSASTAGQAGGQVRVENGGSNPFAGGGLLPLPAKATVTATVAVAPAGNPATDRYLTCTIKGSMATTASAAVPYIYADRYNPATGVGTI